VDVILKENDKLILKMSAKKLATKQSVRPQFHTYSIKENVVMHALVDGWAPRLGAVMIGDVARLELGEHRISKELTDLELSKTARSGQYTEGMMTKLHDPDQSWNVDTLAPLESRS
jgi:hypothetical protein